jgi:hypothetical protein
MPINARREVVLRSYQRAARDEKDHELLEQVRNAALLQQRADAALKGTILAAYQAGVPMTHIARAWGKTEGAVRMYLKRKYGRRGQGL